MILDILILAILAFAAYYGFKNGMSGQLYELVKIFVGFTVASQYAGGFGVWLVRKGILYPDNWAVLLLIGFLLLFIAYWMGVMLLEKLYEEFLEETTKKFQRILAAVVTFMEALFLLTLTLYLLSQVKVVKNKAYNYMHRSSFLYPPMEHFCQKIITVNFVNSLVSNTSGTSSKELLINTLTDEKTYHLFDKQ